jgi:hypothetical protein
VDADDYFKIDTGFASGGMLTGYGNGDFDYSGGIDADDYFLIDNSFAGQGSPLAVPEPGMAGLAMLTGAAQLGRRRRK